MSIILDGHVWNMNDLAVSDGDAASTETSQSPEYKSSAEFLSMGILTVPDLRREAPLRPKMVSISCSFSEILAKSYVGASVEG